MPRSLVLPLALGLASLSGGCGLTLSLSDPGPDRPVGMDAGPGTEPDAGPVEEPDAGAPVPCATMSDCDDGVSCTNDLCVEGLCVREPSCPEPSDACMTTRCDPDLDACVEEPVVCPNEDGIDCTVEECVDGRCIVTPLDERCEGSSLCAKAECVPGVGCDTSGSVSLCPSGQTCEDGGCALTESCVVGGNCFPLNECLEASCVENRCVQTPANDGVACRRQECLRGTCGGGRCQDLVPDVDRCMDPTEQCVARRCGAGGICRTARLNGAPCSNADAPCMRHECVGGACAPTGALACPDDDPYDCRRVTCDASMNCVPETLNGTTCLDADGACGTCDEGTCVASDDCSMCPSGSSQCSGAIPPRCCRPTQVCVSGMGCQDSI